MSEWWLVGLLVTLSVLASALIIYPLRRNLFLSLVLIPIMFVLMFGGYHFWGGFAPWQAYVKNTNSQEQARAMLKSIKTPQELIDKLRAKLDDSPESAKGWYLLGRLYSNQNDSNNAVTAFAKAHSLKPQDEQFTVNYAQSLWELNQRQFNAQIRDLFNTLLKNNPNQPDALAMLAMDAFMSQSYEDAINYWQRLLKIAPQQSEEADAIRKAIAKAQEKIGLKNFNN